MRLYRRWARSTPVLAWQLRTGTGCEESDADNFDGPLTLYYLFLDNAPILLIALPMTLVIVTGEIDLSVASIVGVSAALTGIFHVDVGLSIPVAAALAVGVGVIAGAVNGVLVAYVGLPSLAVTIGVCTQKNPCS